MDLINLLYDKQFKSYKHKKDTTIIDKYSIESTIKHPVTSVQHRVTRAQ
jgi:hypothetical protein